MVAHIHSMAFQGIDVVGVDVQVHLSSGLPAFTIVGLADKAVTESRERVRSALHAIGLALPPERVTVNLAPADLAKEGSHFDLPIALGLLVAMKVIPQDALTDYMVLGELSLDGTILPVNGTLPAAIGASARNKGLICPYKNGTEAAWAGELDILAPPSLVALVNHIKGTQCLSSPHIKAIDDETDYPDLVDIKGQESAKRALEIAAAGGHNMLMSGPPGSGKSMLAARLPGIMPPLTTSDMLEVSMVHSIAGTLTDGKIIRKRPFRSPHHNCSMPAMTGGGSKVKPGELSLAHKGILFLDELPEFPRQVLESLRQPMETREISVARVQSHVTYPADFQLIAAMNPCRCGYLDSPAQACNKAPRCARDYQSKLSGPLLDRIDLHVDVPAINPSDIYQAKEGESSAIVAKRVLLARRKQEDRYGAGMINAKADGALLRTHATPDAAGRDMLEKAVAQLGISMRGHNRILKVARTIADLESSDVIHSHHIAEALSYRPLQYTNQREKAGQ